MAGSECCVDAGVAFVHGEQPCRFGAPLLAMPPHRRDRGEPRTRDRHGAGHDPHRRLAGSDLLVVGGNPPADLLTAVPGGVVPDQQQRGLARRRQGRAAPGHVLRRHRTDRPPGHPPPDQQPGAGHGLRGGLGHPAPPDLAGKAKGPVRGVAARRIRQPRAFCRWYAGSGLVIQVLTRRQRGPHRPGPPDPVSRGWPGGQWRAGSGGAER
jgi:hypothetical protein